jgi:ubiquinone/menaquinone biosynthesis C-methylase UbiE
MRVARKPGLEKEFDSPAATAYNRLGRHPVFLTERRLALRELEACKPRGLLLDAGCGPAYLTAEISRRHPGLGVMGLDNNPAVLALAKQNLGGLPVELVCASVYDMPLPESSVDFVVATGTLHHWTEVKRALSEIHRVLRSGGQLLVMDLRRDCPHGFYLLIRIFNIFMSPAMKRSNGPVGSFWASYTPAEIASLMPETLFTEWLLKKGTGWYFLRAKKS